MLSIEYYMCDNITETTFENSELILLTIMCISSNFYFRRIVD